MVVLEQSDADRVDALGTEHARDRVLVEVIIEITDKHAILVARSASSTATVPEASAAPAATIHLSSAAEATTTESASAASTVLTEAATTASTLVHVKQIGKGLALTNSEVELTARFLGMLESVFEGLGLCLLDVEHGAVHAGEGAHALDLGVDVFGHVAAEDRPDQANALESLSLHLDVVGDEVLLAVEKRPVGHLLLVAAGDEGERLE